ncbi:hypothetical protein [Caudoviricetes sp.]|nr:hypothetical protein [Caudoviricetes sp.]
MSTQSSKAQKNLRLSPRSAPAARPPLRHGRDRGVCDRGAPRPQGGPGARDAGGDLARRGGWGETIRGILEVDVLESGPQI